MSKIDLILTNNESDDGNDLSDFQLKKIFNLYNKQLVIPKHKNKTILIVCPVGLVGSGKTTVLKPLSKKLNLLRISTDEIRKILKQNGYNYLRTKEIAVGLVLKYLKRKYSIALDSDCVTPDVKEYVNYVKKEYKVVPIWIHIKPKEDFIINKLRKYRHTWLFKNSDEAISIYKKRKILHKKYLKEIVFDYIFDTSAEDLNKQVAMFATKVKNNYILD